MKKITVSIGIPAYNEHQNLGVLLKTLLQQEQRSFIINEVLVVLDGCTDESEQVVRSIKDNRIKIFKNKKRKGQQESQNTILKKFDADALLLCEADTLPQDTLFIEKLIRKFRRIDPNHVMIAGTPKASIENSLYQKVQNVGYNTRVKFFCEMNGGKNVYAISGHSGRLLSRRFAKSFQWPANVPEDAYLYFYIKSLGYSFDIASDARLVVACPAIFNDRKKQIKKFLSGKHELRKYFNESIIDSDYAFGIRKKIAFLLCGLQEFDHYFVLYILDKIVHSLFMGQTKNFSKLHDQYHSTKRVKHVGSFSLTFPFLVNTISENTNLLDAFRQ